MKIDKPMLEELSIVMMQIVSGEHEATTTSTSVAHAEDPTETNCFDATYDLEQDASAQSVLTQFVEDWVSTLNCENMISLALFLTYNPTSILIFSCTKAAEYSDIIMNKSDRTVRQWHSDFRENSAILDSKQGRYQHSRIV